MCWLIYVLNGCLDLITAQEICFAELTRETAAAKAGSVFTKVNFEHFLSSTARKDLLSPMPMDLIMG